MANTAVFGIYPSTDGVETAVGELRNQGFRSTDISVLWPQNLGSKDLAHARATKAPEGATAGAGSGAMVGATLGWLVGIGLLAVPGLDQLVAAGPIVASLAGAGAGGVIGGLTGAVVGFGIPEYEAKRYEGRLRRGGILLSVHADDNKWTRRAKQVLRRTGAQHVAAEREVKGDFANGERPARR